MNDGVFNERLQDQAGNEKVLQVRWQVQLVEQAVLQPIFLDIQIVQRVAVFHVQRYQGGAGVHAVLHELAQGYHHGADVQFVPVNEHPVDGVQGVV